MQGDSGFMLVRGGEVLMQSEPLQHFFDCPFQFGAIPEHVSATDYAEVSRLGLAAMQGTQMWLCRWPPDYGTCVGEGGVDNNRGHLLDPKPWNG